MQAANGAVRCPVAVPVATLERTERDCRVYDRQKVDRHNRVETIEERERDCRVSTLTRKVTGGETVETIEERERDCRVMGLPRG